MPPQPYHAHSTGDRRKSVYTGLYNEPKHAPKLDLRAMLRIPFRPTRALTDLYLSTDLRWTMVLVAVSAIVYSVVSAFVTSEMYDVIGAEYLDAFEAVLLALLGLIVALVSFLIFALVSSIVAAELFGGRGDRGSTVILTGYCFPWFVSVSLVILAIFSLGFSDLELNQMDHWSDAEMTQAIVWGAGLLIAAVMGLIWLLFLAGKAIGVANDLSTGEGAMSAVIGAICAGLVSVVVGAVLRLPIGLSF